MSEEIEIKEYDENEAVNFIRNFLPGDMKEKYSDDEILLVTDIIFEYYDKKGFLDIDVDPDSEADINVEDLIDYVKKQLRKDPDNNVEANDVENIVLGELEYEKSLYYID